MTNVMRQQGVDLKLRLWSDSSAAIGHCARLGNGKRMRHLENHDLWIQQTIKAGRATICKINGKQNPADLFTKHLSQNEMVIHMSALGFRLINHKGEEIGIKIPLVESRNASHADHESDDEYEDEDQWINYLEKIYKTVGLVLPVQSTGDTLINQVGDTCDVVVDQKTIPVDEAPLLQVDTVARLHEPSQVSNLEVKTTAQSKDHPSITPIPPKPSWVTVAKRTTTNATTRSTTSSKAALSEDRSTAETQITARTQKTSTDFGKIFKKLDEPDAKLEKTMNEKGYGSYGGQISDHGVRAASHHGEGCENTPLRST